MGMKSGRGQAIPFEKVKGQLPSLPPWFRGLWSDAGSDNEAVSKLSVHPDSAFCALIIVAQDVDNFSRYSIHQHYLPHGLKMHTVEGS